MQCITSAPPCSRRKVLLASLATAFCGVGRQAGAAHQDVIVAGTGNALATMRRMASAYMRENPDTAIIVPPSLGSDGGIRALLDKAIDIALSARPVTIDEAAQGVRHQLYARTPLVFVTAGPSAPERLELQDIAAIYNGAFETWASGRPVRLVLRPGTDSTTSLIKDLSPDIAAAVDTALARPGLLVALTDQENVTLLERLPGSFGVTALGQLVAEGVHLSIVDVPGTTTRTVDLDRGGSHLQKCLHLVTRPDMTPAARDFVAFVNSEVGHSVLAETGHLPAPMPARGA